jgi:hypothetical protein
MVTWLIEKAKSAGEGKICPRFNIADFRYQLCCSPLNSKRAFLRNDIVTILMNDTDIKSRVVRSRKLPVPLREEVGYVTGDQDTTPASLDKMYKRDSFVKESQRFGGSLSACMFYCIIHRFRSEHAAQTPKRLHLFKRNNNPRGLHGGCCSCCHVPRHCECFFSPLDRMTVKLIYPLRQALYPEADQFDGFRSSRRGEVESDTHFEASISFLECGLHIIRERTSHGQFACS